MNAEEKARLKPANANPWYCLATLYGEQGGEAVDWGLAEKNLQGWKRWIAAASLSDADRVELARTQQPVREFAAQRDPELNRIFDARMPFRRTFPPDPNEPIDFTGTSFESPFMFRGFNCPQGVSFDFSVFSEIVDFNGAEIPKGVHFTSATFRKHADFNSLHAGNVDISSATFAADTLFSGAAFYGMAKFDSVHFAGTVRFSQSTFSGFTSFARATFSKPAYFNSSRFSEIATFSSATFRGDTDFSSATFSKNAYFHSATFSGNASFVNSQFTALTVFANSTYETKVPDFRGAKLHEATEWHGVRWPPSPRDKDAAHSHVYAYERLKQEMERLKKHEDEQFFFAKELRARRLLVPIWSSARLLNILYDVSSDYGQSAERPLFWLLARSQSGLRSLRQRRFSKEREWRSTERQASASPTSSRSCR